MSQTTTLTLPPLSTIIDSMSEPDVSALLSVQQAIRIIDAAPVQPRTMRVRLSDADGLRLARELVADRDYPPFDRSQMDGYAVRAADVANAPVELRIVGEVAAGKMPDRQVGPGEAISIMTGAPVPGGADGVVPVEDTEKTEDRVRIVRADKSSRFIAPRGSDCPAGQTVLRRGTLLGPAQIAVACSIGAAEVDVFARPRVAVLATGDELVPIDREPGPGQIRNSNTPMLMSLLRRLGCEVSDLGTVPDEPEATRAGLLRGLEYDALFVTGGMSMGTYDYVPRLLTELGVELKITKLKVKPGKPFVFGLREGEAPAEPGARPRDKLGSAGASPSQTRFVFGLPGNPVSGFVCTIRLASRLLTRMSGGAVEERWLTGKLDVGMPPNGPREFYQPAIRTAARGADSTHANFAAITPLNWKGSADLFTLARANVLLVRPENDPPLPKGTVVRVLEI